MTLDVRVLGPIEVWVDGRQVPVGGPLARALVAGLALQVRHAVPVDHLISELWGPEPPATAEATLQSYVSRLRAQIGAESVESHDHSYSLEVDPDAIDAVRFERLVMAAEEALDADPGRAGELAMEALELWTGPAFGELGSEPGFQPAAVRLDELRLLAMQVRLEADVALGHHAHAVATLEGLVEDFPYRERFWYLFVDALARDGRRVEALRAVRRLERTLAAVGLEPSADIRTLEQEIFEDRPPHTARLHTPG